MRCGLCNVITNKNGFLQKFASFSFVNLFLFEIISTYPEDQFVNHLLLRYLGCFYHQREKAGKIGHPEKSILKSCVWQRKALKWEIKIVFFVKEKPWNEEIKLCFCQRKGTFPATVWGECGFQCELRANSPRSCSGCSCNPYDYRQYTIITHLTKLSHIAQLSQLSHI